MRAVTLLLSLIFALPAGAEGLRRLETLSDSRGWEAVGRLNLDGRGFCTGALIAPDLVLTAAHCLWDKQTGQRIDPKRMEFLAGWRDGRAAAYRNVRRAVAHPDYAPGPDDNARRVPSDLALIELASAIRLPSVRPYDIAAAPARLSEVGVVSYAHDRANHPSIQELCHVLDHQHGLVVMSCSVDFGSSGAPVFALQPDGPPRIVSVVAAKARINGEPVSLGSDLRAEIDRLRAAMGISARDRLRGTALPQIGNPGEGAKFLRP